MHIERAILKLYNEGIIFGTFICSTRKIDLKFIEIVIEIVINQNNTFNFICRSLRKLKQER